MKTIIMPLLAAVLAAFPCAAQTASELLQKGIFAQETQGNLDSAIQLFRQAVGSAGTQRDIAAQAQYRLAQALLRKGDTGNAALEMDRLAREFPDQRELIANLASSRNPLGLGVAPPTASEFDMSKLVTIQGKVTQMLWINPRSWIKVTDASGAEWNVATASPNQLIKQNFVRNSLQLGDNVSITASPALDGTKTAAADTVVRQSDGVKLFDRSLVQAAEAADALKAAAQAIHEKK